jgi:hypothetical protein
MSDEANKNIEEKCIPWRWLGAGLFVTVLGCLAAYLFLLNFLNNQSLMDLAVQPEITIIVLTAPASPTLPPTTQAVIPTPIPTFTPIPTPDTAVAPPEITAGYYAVVANTDGLGVTVRGGPSISNVAILVAVEGTSFIVLDGPVEGDGFNWWQVQLEDETSGWIAANFLEPAAAP